MLTPPLVAVLPVPTCVAVPYLDPVVVRVAVAEVSDVARLVPELFSNADLRVWYKRCNEYCCCAISRSLTDDAITTAGR